MIPKLNFYSSLLSHDLQSWTYLKIFVKLLHVISFIFFFLFRNLDGWCVIKQMISCTWAIHLVICLMREQEKRFSGTK